MRSITATLHWHDIEVKFQHRISTLTHLRIALSLYFSSSAQKVFKRYYLLHALTWINNITVHNNLTFIPLFSVKNDLQTEQNRAQRIPATRARRDGRLRSHLTFELRRPRGQPSSDITLSSTDLGAANRKLGVQCHISYGYHSLRSLLPTFAGYSRGIVSRRNVSRAT